MKKPYPFLNAKWKILEKAVFCFSFKTIFSVTTCVILVHVLLFKAQASALPEQEGLQMVSGIITDSSTGESLPGVNITVQGTNMWTISKRARSIKRKK